MPGRLTFTRSFSIAYGSFTTGTFVVPPAKALNLTHVRSYAPFNFITVRNQTDQDVQIFLNGQPEPALIAKASGGSATINVQDSWDIYTLPIFRNNSGTNAASGSMFCTVRSVPEVVENG